MGEQIEETGHSSSDYPLELVSVSSSWNGKGFKLRDISIQLSLGTLTGVIGPVGSGKSSLLLTIVREMEITEGRVHCGGTIGYYSQTPWLFNGEPINQSNFSLYRLPVNYNHIP